VVLDLVPQILAEACSAVVSRFSGQERSDQAAVLIGREVEDFVMDTDRIALLERVARLSLEVREPVLVPT
jgi:hypothetical protein